MLSMALSGLTDRKGNMLVSIQPSTDERVLRNLEAVLLIEPNRMKEVTLTRIGAQKYLYKLCQSQRSAKDKKSLGEMIEALKGCILSISDGFREK